jgi:hypothetical protein
MLYTTIRTLQNLLVYLNFETAEDSLCSQSNIDGALEAYQAAVVESPQREIQLLCLHEVGWCHLIQLDWNQAHQCFLQLKVRSRWSKSFYSYLAAGMLHLLIIFNINTKMI